MGFRSSIPTHVVCRRRSFSEMKRENKSSTNAPVFHSTRRPSFRQYTSSTTTKRKTRSYSNDPSSMKQSHTHSLPRAFPSTPMLSHPVKLQTISFHTNTIHDSDTEEADPYPIHTRPLRSPCTVEPLKPACCTRPPLRRFHVVTLTTCLVGYWIPRHLITRQYN